jgi:hypothetical protein
MTDEEMDKIALEVKNDKTDLTKSAYISHNINPDQYSRNIKDAKAKGIPRAFATPATTPVNPNKLDSLVADFNQLEGKTASHFSNPDVAQIAHDDTKSHTLFEKTVETGKQYFGMIENALTQTTGWMGFNPMVSIPNIIGSTAAAVAEGFVTEKLPSPFGRGVGAKTDIKGVVSDIGSRFRGGLSAFTYKPISKEGEKQVEFTGKTMESLTGILDAIDKDDDIKRQFPNTYGIIQTGASFAPWLMVGAGLHGKVKATLTDEQINKALEISRTSSSRTRDMGLHKDFVNNTTDGQRVTVPVNTVSDIIEKSGKTPEEVLSDPVAYHESKMNGDKYIDVPLADVTANAEHIEKDHVKEMKMQGDNQSLADVERDENNIRPAVVEGEQLHIGDKGQRHTDIVPDAPEEARGFITPGGEFIDRAKASEWLKDNRPDIYNKLPEKAKAELHSEDLWKAQEIELTDPNMQPPKEALKRPGGDTGIKNAITYRHSF